MKGRALVAPLTSMAGTPAQTPAMPRDELRRALADAWANDARFEHASIASFAKLSLELLALGAMAELVAASHRAALDEVEHARLCFALASRYAAEPIGPGALDLGSSVALATTLERIAAAAVVEGCVGETLGAIEAAEAARARDPIVARALRVIAEDEAKHAELSRRVVAWPSSAAARRCARRLGSRSRAR